jgi:hypothetical protein
MCDHGKAAVRRSELRMNGECSVRLPSCKQNTGINERYCKTACSNSPYPGVVRRLGTDDMGLSRLFVDHTVVAPRLLRILTEIFTEQAPVFSRMAAIGSRVENANRRNVKQQSVRRIVRMRPRGKEDEGLPRWMRGSRTVTV